MPAPPTHPALRDDGRAAANLARMRHRARLARLRRLAQQRAAKGDRSAGAELDAPGPEVAGPPVGSAEHKRRAIAAARARARARRGAGETGNGNTV